MLSYWGLRTRGLPKTKAYLIGEHFLPNMKVWVDSGATQADKANLSIKELEDYAADYEEFIALNYDRIEGFVEFDSQVLGLPRIVQNRSVYENDPKLWVVWHSSYNTSLLQSWSAQYYNIAIPSDAIESVTSLSAITRKLVQQHPVAFHALATAKPDNLRQIPFSTASTLSWLSPMRRGETIVWDNNRLVRYPKKMKAQARPRYKNIVQKAGLDFQKFVSDDTLESTRVAVWSYLQLEKSMAKSKPTSNSPQDGKTDMVSDNNDDTLYTGLMDFGGGGSNNSDLEMRKEERPEVVQRDPQDVVSMPVMGYQMKTVVDHEDGQSTLKDIPVVQSNYGSLRQCNSCFVAANCPAFKEDNTCGFNLPIEVKTPDQLKALNTAMLEMQAQRVMFMRFAEELNGGYADPNVSQEIDRYQKMLKNIKELDESKEFIQITAQKSASQGMLSAIFGDKVQAMKEQQSVISEEKTTLIIKNNLEG
ncbi:hypothetical protein UFOVP45_94 [uncultured Caudovirales phage]|uniref:Uncharacterized protein n=1 Tax=uncultured Caudovirales phage TaxID=2100421 RepID=A0A6J5KS72_9CAUD|nr:hypothetical protein UFOVP45_94 [uncultured Caudovirales phage]